MIVEILSKEREVLGILEGYDRPIRVDIRNQELSLIVDGALKDGLNQKKELYDFETKTFTLGEKQVFSSDPMFFLALCRLLRNNGYILNEKNEELDQELRRLVISLPDSDKSKREILSDLPEMSVLEKSLLIQLLRVK